MSIHQKIRTFYGKGTDEHHRNRSWEHCYCYFRNTGRDGLAADRDHAALQLGFYLASWGMYRGSGFLLKHAYTVHQRVIDLIAESRFGGLWGADFGARETDDRFVPTIIELANGIRQSYPSQPTDTLITKIVLGTFACLPACDRYFIHGFEHEGLRYSGLNDKFVERVLNFCRPRLDDLHREQANIEESSGIRYPLMKLVDMYFHQIGSERVRKSRILLK